MGVFIESFVWEPNPSVYLFIFFLCFFSIILLPYFSKNSSNRASTVFDHALSSSFLRFQRSFLFLYSLACVTEGMWSVFGEFELAYYGVTREQMVVYLCVGCVVAVVFGTCFGMLADLIGQKKVCLIFWTLHLFIGMLKWIISHPSIWVASICLSLATSLFSFSFETWMVVEHDKLGHRQDTLSDMFWLMTFSESASLIGSQVLANWLVGDDLEKNIVSPSIAAIVLAIMGIFSTTRGWTETPQTLALKDYRMSFSVYIFGDKRIWLLACAQACLHFSISFFWILWAPTLVADGREVHLGLVYPCLLGARMLGSTVFPWLIHGPSPLRTEEYLVYAFIMMGFVLSIVAYDYQGGYFRNLGNATIMAFAALGLFAAAGCMHVLKQWGKQPYQYSHKL
ncbi:uncharacterized protein LOC131152677 isoform X2 [Malania oleifera]|uniref:uncharacterized protein LOC131152677 isoform X2 n=1 Tax=Malania oleifera TaxID=397392 RepID=UPI0025AEA8B6|nr:uncharacterized protein LOC131152677 isoform X2 [Malania oleifera]